MRSCAAGLICMEHMCGTPACATNADCSGTTPTCDTTTHTCVGCIDSSQCGGATPVCDSMTMACVGCLDSSQCMNPAPICDTSMMTCRACTTDDECPSKVCDVDSGSCVDGSSVLYAAPGAADTSDCGLNTPCSITHAIALADAVKNTIRMLPGTYTAAVQISGKGVSIVGTGAILASSANTSVDANSNADVGIRGLDVEATSASQAIGCSSQSGRTTLTLTDVTANTALAAGQGLTASNCQLQVVHAKIDGASITTGTVATFDRSWIHGTGDWAIYMNGASSPVSVAVTNSVLVDGVRTDLIGDYGVLRVSFSTIVSSGSAGFPTPQSCSSSGSAHPPTVTFSDDIIFGGTMGDSLTISNASCTVDHVLAYPQSTSIPGVTSTMDPMLVDPTNGDYHLKAGSPAIDLGDPTATDAHDYDGTPRPQGTRDDLGAFEYHP